MYKVHINLDNLRTTISTFDKTENHRWLNESQVKKNIS